jgi:hypothetical protein
MNRHRSAVSFEYQPQQDRARATLRRDIEAAFTHTDEQVAGLSTLNDLSFAAAKEAVIQQNNTTNLMMQKNENMFPKQIDSLGGEIETTTGALSDKIEEVKKQMGLQGQTLMMMQGQGSGACRMVEAAVKYWVDHVGGGRGVSFLAFLVMLFNVLTGKV